MRRLESVSSTRIVLQGSKPSARSNSRKPAGSGLGLNRIDSMPASPDLIPRLFYTCRVASWLAIMQLSKHFSLDQLIQSETALEQGIDNTPPPDTVENLRRLADGLEQVQALLENPLSISSGYRCPALNNAVGGSPGSQHVLGLAADFTCQDFGTPLAVAQAIGTSAIEFDQCILEFGRWVHISFSVTPRVRLLTIHDAAVGYLEGLWDREGNRLA